MNFSTEILVSILNTNCLYPNSKDFATPKPNVISGACFFPSLTTTSRSPSKSKANPMSFLDVAAIKSVKLSVVGSGPLVQLSRFSLITLTLHPNCPNKFGANPFAAPPPISITISGLVSILPMSFSASSRYEDVIRSSFPILDFRIF